VGGEDPLSNAVLEVRGVAADLPHHGRLVPVLRDVSFSIAEGEIVGLVGESGSGKSMTARTVVRLLPKGSKVTGRVLVGGNEVPLSGRALRDVRRRRIAMIFQDPRAHIDPLYRTGDHLVEGLRAQGGTTKEGAKNEALVLLASVGIDDPERVFRAYPAEISGGMLQRLMIAGALTADPELIIADEPTTALDVTTQAEIVALLSRLCRERGRGSLFITHDLDLAAAICDRVLVMYAGRIVEENRSDRFFSGPLHPYSARLLRARPMIDSRSRSLAVIPGRPVSAVDSPDGCPFHPRCAYGTHECQTWTPVLTSIDGGWSGCRRVREIRSELRDEVADA
jgi:oligopeptide/dipeptide ABC transporter ATP-binding protein